MDWFLPDAGHQHQGMSPLEPGAEVLATLTLCYSTACRDMISDLKASKWCPVIELVKKGADDDGALGLDDPLDQPAAIISSAIARYSS